MLALMNLAPLILSLALASPGEAEPPYPHPVRTFAFESQRQRLEMAYLDVPAARPNGQVVLLLHGKNFSAAYWGPTIAALTAAGFRVVAPDQIGFGRSSKPEHFQFSFAALAAHTRALLDSLRIEKVAVVGHSMGGMLATRFALLWPGRVTGLALVNPIGLEDYARFVGSPPVDRWYEKERAQTPEKIRAYQKQSYYAGQWKPAYEALMAQQAAFTRRPDFPRLAWIAALTTDMILTQPIVHELPDLTVRTSLIIGTRDRTALGRDLVPAEVAARMGDYPRLGKAAAERIPGARLVELPEAGHLPQVEAFDKYREALLGFLAR